MRKKPRKYYVEKVLYADGVGCCLHGGKNNPCCYDFPASDLDKIIEVLELSRIKPAKDYVNSKEAKDYEKFKAEQKIKESKWWYKLHKLLEDITLQIRPFDWYWRFNFPMLLGIPTIKKDCKTKSLKVPNHGGWHLGPVVITW